MEGRGKRKREGGREGGRGKWEEVGRTGRKREEQRGREEDRKGRERVNSINQCSLWHTAGLPLSIPLLHASSTSQHLTTTHSSQHLTAPHLLKGHSRANNRFTIDREDMITNTQLSFLYKKER